MENVPFVIHNAITEWPSNKWTPLFFKELFGNKLFRFRLGPKKHKIGKLLFENDCEYCTATIADFLHFIQPKSSENDDSDKNLHIAQSIDNPFNAFSYDTHFAYLDYKYMFDMFDENEEYLADIQWRNFGLEKDGFDSTLWMGTRGAYTPCHYDTYGFNLGQIYGRKRWTLFPPNQSKFLDPRRLPYEESSVFSGLDLLLPWERNSEKFLRQTTPMVVTLEPGDLLYVPHKWWHFVQCLDDGCISVNTWVDLEADKDAKLTEAITRCTVGLVKNNCAKELLDNEVDFQDSFALLQKLVLENFSVESSDPQIVEKKRKVMVESGDEFLKQFLQKFKSTAVDIPILSFEEFSALMKNDRTVFSDAESTNLLSEKTSNDTILDKNAFINALLHPSTVDNIKKLILNFK